MPAMHEIDCKIFGDDMQFVELELARCNDAQIIFGNRDRRRGRRELHWFISGDADEMAIESGVS